MTLGHGRRRAARDQGRLVGRRPRRRQRPDAGAAGAKGDARGAGGGAAGRRARSPRPIERAGRAMRISHFFIDRPIFASVVSIVFVILGGVSLFAAADRAISGDRAADHQRHRPVSRRQRRRRRLDRGRADRGADQRRREHALHVVELDGRRPLLDRRDASISAPISTSRRCRCRTASRSRSRACRPTCAISASPSTKSSPDLMMVVHLYSPDKSRDTLFISNYATLADQGRADPHRRRRLDHRVRQPRLCDADLARSRAAAVARPDRRRRRRRRCRARTSRSPPACSISRRSPSQVAFQVAVQTLGRLADPEEFGNIVVKQTADRGGAAARTSRGSSSPRRTIPPTPISIAIPRSRWRCSSGRARTRWRPRRTSRATMEQLSKRFPAGHQVHHRLRSDPVHPAIGRRGDGDDRRGGPPRRAGGHPVPADLARRRHSDRRHSGLADRHLLLHGDVRLHAQQSVAVRAGARDRHRGRRRDRRGGERRAQHRGRPGAARRRHQEHGRGRRRAGRDCARAVRGVRSVGLHHRHFRPVLPAIRAHHRRRDGHLADRVADAVAGDVRAAAQAARHREQRVAWWERPIRGFFAVFNWGFERWRAAIGWLIGAGGALRRASCWWSMPALSPSASTNSARRRSASFRSSTAAISSSSLQLPPGASLARTDEVQTQAVEIALSRRRASRTP